MAAQKAKKQNRSAWEKRVQKDKGQTTDCVRKSAVGHFSLIKEVRTIRSLSWKNPFCAIVKGLRFPKTREEQIPTAISEKTTKRVNCYENGNLPLFCIEKDTRGGVLYAPFACVLMVETRGLDSRANCALGLPRL